MTPDVTQGTACPRPRLRQKPPPSPPRLSSDLELSVSPAPGAGADSVTGARGRGREPPAGLGTGVDACSQGGQHRSDAPTGGPAAGAALSGEAAKQRKRPASPWTCPQTRSRPPASGRPLCPVRFRNFGTRCLHESCCAASTLRVIAGRGDTLGARPALFLGGSPRSATRGPFCPLLSVSDGVLPERADGDTETGFNEQIRTGKRATR